MWMPDMKRFRFWFMVLSIQLVLAAVIPAAFLLVLPPKEASVTFELPGLMLKDLPPQEAIKQTEAFFRNIVSEGAIVYEGKEERLQIPYSSIWLQFDTEEINKVFEKGQYQNRFFELIGKTSAVPRQISAHPYMNESLFREKMSPIQEICHMDAGNARLLLQQGAVSVIPHSNGRDFDVNRALLYVTERLKADPAGEIVLSEDATPWLFSATEPEITTEMLQSYTQVYGLTQGTIPEGKTEALLNLIRPMENKMIDSGGLFSFRENISSLKETDSLQQFLASCVYQTVLPVENIRVIERKAAVQPVSGIDPGLEVSFENGGDLQFKNTADIPLMLVFEVGQDGRFYTALAGKPGLKSSAIRTESVKIQPSVIYSQDNTLPKDSKEVIEPGKEGLTVKVYRVTEDESIILYEDVYQPVHQIIAIGTGIRKEDIVYK